jgi:hypothetical protein
MSEAEWRVIADWPVQYAELVAHGPTPPIRVIMYRTMKPGGASSGMGN